MTRLPALVSVCPECGRQIGVQPDWNTSQVSRFPRSKRLSAHFTRPGGERCVGSRIIVSDENVWPSPRKTAG